MLMRALGTLLLLVITAVHARAEAFLEARSTWAVVAGVLSWQDKGLSSFSKDQRKDQELFDDLAALGVPARQRTLLLDDKATTRGIEDALRAAVAAAPAGSTLLFYYAGHGVKDDAGAVVFASWDISLGDVAGTGLRLAQLGKILEGFKGRRLILLADCCYSGGLGAVAEHVAAARPAVQAMALTSAEASNISTGNWTFTQTVIDALNGRPLLDRNEDGSLTLGELASEVKDSMRYREGQRSGWVARGLPDEVVVAAAKSERSRGERGYGDFERRDWVRTGPARKVARIIAFEPARLKGRSPRLLVEHYDYATRTETWVSKSDAEPVAFKTWPPGTSLDVTWGGQVWDAKVLRVEDGFMWITYPGWDAKWDEWITAARVVEGIDKRGKRAKVEWRGRWYDAVVKSEGDGRWCISYVGYGPEWDECVGQERIRLR